MAKFRAWYGNKPTIKNVSSLREAMKIILKNDDFDESNSGIEELIDSEWDEWLDEDDQNVHEHLFMYETRSKYLRDDDDFEDDDFDDDDDDAGDDDMEERLLNVIGGNSRASSSERSKAAADDDDDDDDDSEDADEFDEEEEFAD